MRGREESGGHHLCEHHKVSQLVVVEAANQHHVDLDGQGVWWWQGQGSVYRRQHFVQT